MEIFTDPEKYEFTEEQDFLSCTTGILVCTGGPLVQILNRNLTTL